MSSSLTELFLCSSAEKTYISSTHRVICLIHPCPQQSYPWDTLKIFRIYFRLLQFHTVTCYTFGNYKTAKSIYSFFSLQIMLLPGKIILFFSNEPISIFWALWLTLSTVEHLGNSCGQTEFKLVVCENVQLDFPDLVSALILHKEQKLASREMVKGVAAQKWPLLGPVLGLQSTLGESWRNEFFRVSRSWRTRLKCSRNFLASG